MEHMVEAGVLYEMVTVYESEGDTVRIELWDMSAAGRMLGEFVVAPGIVRLVQARIVPLTVFRWWGEAALREAEPDRGKSA